MTDANEGTDEQAGVPDGVETFESTQRLDPDAFQHAKSRVDGGYEEGVEALLTDESGRVLLTCEGGRWSLPGGEVPDDEALETALVRAVDATTGLSITVGERLAINEVTLTDGEHEVALSFAIYEGTIEGEATAEPRGGSVSAVEWHEELPPATLDRDMVASLREGR